MKLLATLALTLATSAAFAHGNVSCPAMPKEEKKPQMELQKKLEAEGWKVRKVKDYNGCYEVYAIDADGKKAEVFFNPKTFERVAAEGEKAAEKK